METYETGPLAQIGCGCWLRLHAVSCLIRRARVFAGKRISLFNRGKSIVAANRATVALGMLVPLAALIFYILGGVDRALDLWKEHIGPNFESQEIAQVSPTVPVVVSSPSLPTPTPTRTPTTTPTPASTPTPHLTVSEKTVEEVRTTLRSLMGQALKRRYLRDKDAGLEVVANDGILHGQFDIAFDAALSGQYDSNKSEMLAEVARCVAIEGWYSTARSIAEFIPYNNAKQEVKGEIFDLEHQSLRETPPPLCRQTNWLRMPSFE